MAVDFWIVLPGDKYDRELGWPCSALGVPGSRVSEFRLGGTTLPLEQIKSDHHHVRLVATPETPMPDAAAKISFEKRLITFDSAIVVALIGLLGTLGAAYLGAGSKKPSALGLGGEPIVFKAGGARGISGPSFEFPIPVKSATLDVTSGLGLIKDKHEPRVDGHTVHVSVIPKDEHSQVVYDYTLKVWLKQ